MSLLNKTIITESNSLKRYNTTLITQSDTTANYTSIIEELKAKYEALHNSSIGMKELEVRFDAER